MFGADESSREVLQYHTDTKQHYTETLDNLARINSTVARVLVTLTQLKAGVEQRLAWLASLLGATGGPQNICTTSFICCFLMGFGVMSKILFAWDVVFFAFKK